MSKKNIVFIALTVIVVGALGIVGFYWYEGASFVSTEDARLAGDLVTITPEIAGRISEWNVKEGDEVTIGDVLGRQDLSSALTTGVLNPQTIGAVGAVIAEKAALKAPISGQVIQSNAIVGQMAVPGTPLALIADNSNLYASANIEEGHIEQVHIGEPVEIKVDAFPGKTFHGRVENIGRATNATFSLLPTTNTGGSFTKVTQLIPVKIRLLDKGSVPLLMGMNVSIRITVESMANK